MNKNAIYVIKANYGGAFGHNLELWSPYTLKSLEEYASRVNADLHILTEEDEDTENFPPFFNTFQKGTFLIFKCVKHLAASDYDHGFILDLDMYVYNDCPNIFEGLTDDSFHMTPAINEGKGKGCALKLKQFFDTEIDPALYHNSGYVILSRQIATSLLDCIPSDWSLFFNSFNLSVARLERGPQHEGMNDQALVLNDQDMWVYFFTCSGTFPTKYNHAPLLIGGALALKTEEHRAALKAFAGDYLSALNKKDQVAFEMVFHPFETRHEEGGTVQWVKLSKHQGRAPERSMRKAINDQFKPNKNLHIGHFMGYNKILILKYFA